METWSAWKDFKRRLEQLLFRSLNFPFIGDERTLKYEPFVDSKWQYGKLVDTMYRT